MGDTLFEVEPEVKGVATREPSITEVSYPAMIERALAHPNAEQMANVIEKLLAMQNAERARVQKETFDAAFAKMKEELPIIPNVKEVKTFGGEHMYNYSPHKIVKDLCDPILKKYHFTYAWRSEPSPIGVRVWFDLYGYGHVRSNAAESPLLGAKQSNAGKEILDAAQGARKTVSLLKRYSMMDGLGLISEDEDDENHIEVDAAIEAIFTKIGNAKTDDELMNIYKIAAEQYKDKENTKMLIYGKCQDRRRQLREGAK